MIDADGFRANVGIVLTNSQGKLFWARRIGQQAWQFPQGGLMQDEKPEDALFRELHEEIGLSEADVKLIAETKDWLRYRLPKGLRRANSSPDFIGQKQKWYLLELVTDHERIDLAKHPEPEFDQWRWVSYWYPLRNVIAFKRNVYRRALKEFLQTDYFKNLERAP